jgi:hypothetical protein
MKSPGTEPDERTIVSRCHALDPGSVRIPAGIPAVLIEVSSGFPQSLQTGAGILIRLVQYLFLSNPFQLVFHHSSLFPTLYNLDIRSLVI